MSRRAPVSTLVAAAVVLLCVASCGPKAGRSCRDPGRAVCTAPDAALACVGGTWAPIRCDGASGCRGNKKTTRCDQSRVAAESACMVDKDIACTLDARAMVRCTQGRWAIVEPCRGPGGCAARAGSVSCDIGPARVGEPCAHEGDHACQEGGKAALVCTSGHFAAAGGCLGPKGCRVEKNRIACDDSVAAEGSLCSMEGQMACDKRGDRILRCASSKFAVDTVCAGQRHCVVDKRGVDCKR